MIALKNRFAIILFVAAIISCVFLNLKNFGHEPSGGGDDYYYNYIAQNLIEYGRFSLNQTESTNVSEPLYPIFIAGLYKIFGVKNYDFGPANFDAVRIAQIILFAFTCLLIYFIVRTISEEKIARGAAFLSILFYPLAGITGRLLRETLFTFLIVLSIWLLLKAEKTMKFKWFALTGLVMGLATLTNAVFQFFIFFVILGFVLVLGKNFFTKAVLLRVAVLTTCFIILLAGWSLRNYSSEGAESISLKSGGVLSRKAEMIKNIRGEAYFRNLGGQLFGYYFFEKEGFGESAFLTHKETTARYDVLVSQGMTVKDINAKLASENFPIIIHNIPRYFAISLLDFLQFNGLMLPNLDHLDTASPGQNLFIQNSHQEIPTLIKILILIIIRVVYWLFFGLIIYGLIKTFKNWRIFIWPIFITIYFNLVYSATFGIPRYAIPIYPFYFIFFSFGLWLIYEKLKNKK